MVCAGQISGQSLECSQPGSLKGSTLYSDIVKKTTLRACTGNAKDRASDIQLFRGIASIM